MRRKLAAALVGVAIGALLLYVVPRAFMTASLVRQHEQRLLDRTADLVAADIDARIREGTAVTAVSLAELPGDGERMVVELPDGRVVELGDLEVGDRVIEEERPLAGGGTLTYQRSTQLIEDQLSSAAVETLVISGAVIVFTFVLAFVLAHRLARYFDELTAYAAQVTTPKDPPPQMGVAEADRLADALYRSRVRIEELLQRERQFSSNASHQLRTPLAALRLRLEDLTMWPEVPAEARQELEASLSEVDRLAGTVTGLLDFSRSGGIGTWAEVDLWAVAGEAVDRWEATFEQKDRTIELRGDDDRARVATSERAVQQVLDVLLENALVHGRGAVVVDVAHRGDRVVLQVADEGRMDGPGDAKVFDRAHRSSTSSGSGIGLSLARSIAESVGARLGLARREPTTFELVMATDRPVGTDAAVGDDGAPTVS